MSPSGINVDDASIFAIETREVALAAGDVGGAAEVVAGAVEESTISGRRRVLRGLTARRQHEHHGQGGCGKRTGDRWAHQEPVSAEPSGTTRTWLPLVTAVEPSSRVEVRLPVPD